MDLLSASHPAPRRQRRGPVNAHHAAPRPAQRAPSGRGTWRRCVGAACCGLLLGMLSSAVPAKADTTGSRRLPPRLLQSLRQIESAFRQGDAARLAGVLPRDSKVMVGLDSFSRAKAYYAPDQVILIFRKIFRNLQIVHFHLEYDDLESSRSELLYVPATWSVRRGSSGLRDLRLQFTLRQEGGVYYVRGIKEVD